MERQVILNAIKDIFNACVRLDIHAHQRFGKAEGLALDLRLTWRRNAPLYDGFNDNSACINGTQCASLRRGRCDVCFRTRRCKPKRSSKNESCLKVS